MMLCVIIMSIIILCILTQNVIMLRDILVCVGVILPSVSYAECRSVVRHYAECRGAFLAHILTPFDVVRLDPYFKILIE